MSEDEFILAAGNSHELEMAMNRPKNGTWTPALIHRLCQGNTLGEVRKVLLGNAEIRHVEHIIDCDADPFLPNNWKVLPEKKQLPNRVRGQLKWDPKRVKLHLSKFQKSGRSIKGDKLRFGEFAGKPSADGRSISARGAYGVRIKGTVISGTLRLKR